MSAEFLNIFNAEDVCDLSEVAGFLPAVHAGDLLAFLVMCDWIEERYPNERLAMARRMVEPAGVRAVFQELRRTAMAGPVHHRDWALAVGDNLGAARNLALSRAVAVLFARGLAGQVAAGYAARVRAEAALLGRIMPPQPEESP